MEAIPKLRLDSEGDRLANGYSLAVASHAAYADAPGCVERALAEAFAERRAFRSGWVSGYAAWNDSHVIVAFRGTTEEREWGEGVLDAGQQPWIVGRAQRALINALESVWAPLFAALYDGGFAAKAVWVTGHSLGGALAVLAGQKLDAAGIAPQGVYTFGAPRVLDETAARAYAPRLYRFVNNEDLVANLPWPALLERYEHPGEAITLMASGAVARPVYPAHLARRIDRALSVGDGPMDAGAFVDHRIAAYWHKLIRYAAPY